MLFRAPGSIKLDDPTPEQSAILEAVSGHTDNMMIKALAGTGKTSTLHMIERQIKEPLLCLAFNKPVAQEMEKRFKGTSTVKTMNGLGHTVWSKTQARRLTLNPRKLNEMLAEHIKEMVTKREQKEAWDGYWNVISAANMARCLGYVPSGVFPDAKRLITGKELEGRLEEKPTAYEWHLIDWLLTNSIASAYKGYIDYNDQLYMPALFGGSFPKFPVVMVDEKQDLNPINHQMLEKLSTSRLISVGDPYQSIYAFRGATPNGMALSATRFRMAQYNLSVSFRCPEAVVQNVLWRVGWFKASRAGGHVESLTQIAVEDFQEGSAIICRNNAPLFKMAFKLLAGGRSVSVAGSEIGPKLIGILKRLGDGNMPREWVMGAIQHWRDERLKKGSTTAADMAECMGIFATYGQTLDQAVAYAEHILRQEGSIKLMTGHKAKGLEFDVVYHLDRQLIRLGEEQEDNLRYVIDTRAKDQLYYITSDGVI